MHSFWKEARLPDDFESSTRSLPVGEKNGQRSHNSSDEITVLPLYEAAGLAEGDSDECMSQDEISSGTYMYICIHYFTIVYFSIVCDHKPQSPKLC